MRKVCRQRVDKYTISHKKILNVLKFILFLQNNNPGKFRVFISLQDSIMLGILLVLIICNMQFIRHH